MAIDVDAHREIGGAPALVAAYAMDPANDPVWIGGIREARWLTKPPLRVGSRIERVARFLGRRIEYVLEVTELEPDSRLRMGSVKSPFPMVVTYEFAPHGPQGTQARIRIEGGPGGFAGLFSPLLGLAVRRSISGDLKRLAGIVESADMTTD